ncbi:TetR/AcrR family transcriptional regulator [Mycolicibacterium smegmatis]|uniref:TetR-family protein transcriptional regulator n=3 Tax=Mycolicibacterium smegmatis TaxID=1772 RepID=A0QYY7_MYCS2|nr:TetR/AcrR family transcriptional regulator [Mycolicibacterium smegmatis]ABK71695.1 putative TetR-family protein transcriptional regulator [Mycolicibacterium smegmatis MC2 155]AFP40202.1 Transcriptional regulator, TetR family [Mycolicibacterium smegmatis MC2 155]AIU08952.1 TetR family transcriptional regulator [Mycolicibacterium smegmatis MC2 155]AIU15577.1 TetR family transcriptional regulator [Mycolicibacterium smegmatis]AIU22200.1 TetR family transcriptional regulator [Mycolicibacterium s
MTAGRPQEARVTTVILDAVLSELAEHGFGSMTVDGVAKRAGAGKGAIYRRWPSKIEMTAAAMRTLALPEGAAPDTGSLYGDVLALLADVNRWIGDERMRRLYPDLLAEAQRNPVLAEALMDTVGTPRRARARDILDRAATRGELAPGADSELLVDAMGALVFWRLIALFRPVTSEYLDRVARAICAFARTGPV